MLKEQERGDKILLSPNNAVAISSCQKQLLAVAVLPKNSLQHIQPSASSGKQISDVKLAPNVDQQIVQW